MDNKVIETQEEIESQMMSTIGDMMFRVLTSMIMKENEALFKTISQEHNLNLSDLKKKYLKPEYYLPLVHKDVDKKPPGS